MARDVVIILLTIAVLTVTTGVRVTVPGTVTVRRGEPLQLSCDITFEAGDHDIKAARWYRMQDSGLIVYWATDVSGGCGSNSIPCIVGNTTDNRGTVQYERGTFNSATLKLTINKSVLEDDTMFRCVVFSSLSGTSHFAQISVTINYFPNATYPMCFVSSYIPGPPVLPSILSCSSELAKPTVSLLWTTSVSPTVLAGNSGIVGDHIKNVLYLDPSWTYATYFCHMKSDAFPEIERNCSVDIRPPIISTDSSSVSAPHDQPTTPDSSMPTLHFTDPSPTNSNPSSFSPVIIAVLSAVGGIIIILLVIIVYLVLSRRKARRWKEKGRNLPPSSPTIQGGVRDAGPTIRAPPLPLGACAVQTVGSEQLSPRSTSLQALPSDTRGSTNSLHHSYETRFGRTVAELHPQEPDQRQRGQTPVTGNTVERLQPQFTENGYTAYIVEDTINGKQANSNTDYMPLSPYEEVGNAPPCDYENLHDH